MTVFEGFEVLGDRLIKINKPIYWAGDAPKLAGDLPKLLFSPGETHTVPVFRFGSILSFRQSMDGKDIPQWIDNALGWELVSPLELLAREACN